MQRGQAFDAFKLLIAAVVAGAILVILLSMIGGFVPVGQDPLTVMGQELNKVKKGGVASTSSQVVQFQEGQEFTANAVAKEAGLSTGQVQFCCTDGVTDLNNKCTSTSGDVSYRFDAEDSKASFEECSPQELIVNSQISGKIRAYCPVESSAPCIIGFKVSRG